MNTIDPFTDVARNELWDSLRLSDDAAKQKKMSHRCAVWRCDNDYKRPDLYVIVVIR